MNTYNTVLVEHAAQSLFRGSHPVPATQSEDLKVIGTRCEWMFSTAANDIRRWKKRGDDEGNGPPEDCTVRVVREPFTGDETRFHAIVSVNGEDLPAATTDEDIANERQRFVFRGVPSGDEEWENLSSQLLTVAAKFHLDLWSAMSTKRALVAQLSMATLLCQAANVLQPAATLIASSAVSKLRTLKAETMSRPPPKPLERLSLTYSADDVDEMAQGIRRLWERVGV